MQETTDANGKASFETEYGDYKVTISADGYTTKTENIAFRSNHKNFTIALETIPTGTVTVNAIWRNDPMNNLQVYLLLEDAPISLDNLYAMGRTDATGTTPLYEKTSSGGQSTTIAQIPYGDYYYCTSYDMDNRIPVTIDSAEKTLNIEYESD